MTIADEPKTPGAIRMLYHYKGCLIVFDSKTLTYTGYFQGITMSFPTMDKAKSIINVFKG